MTTMFRVETKVNKRKPKKSTCKLQVRGRTKKGDMKWKTVALYALSERTGVEVLCAKLNGTWNADPLGRSTNKVRETITVSETEFLKP